MFIVEHFRHFDIGHAEGQTQGGKFFALVVVGRIEIAEVEIPRAGEENGQQQLFFGLSEGEQVLQLVEAHFRRRDPAVFPFQFRLELCFAVFQQGLKHGPHLSAAVEGLAEVGQTIVHVVIVQFRRGAEMMFFSDRFSHVGRKDLVIHGRHFIDGHVSGDRTVEIVVVDVAQSDFRNDVVQELHSIIGLEQVHSVSEKTFMVEFGHRHSGFLRFHCHIFTFLLVCCFSFHHGCFFPLQKPYTLSSGGILPAVMKKANVFSKAGPILRRQKDRPGMNVYGSDLDFLCRFPEKCKKKFTGG